MSPSINDGGVLARIMAAKGWATIDELYQAYKSEVGFDQAFIDRATENAGKAALRKMLRTGKVHDAAGNAIDVASIITKDEQGKPK